MVDVARIKVESLTMLICSGGAFIVGRLIGGNKLTKPRLISIIDDGKRIQMSPLPGTPPFMRVGMESNYPIPETEGNKALYDLYERVTNQTVDKGEG
jgi:hypothetical protein